MGNVYAANFGHRSIAASLQQGKHLAAKIWVIEQ
jgi:hypothetical protein